ncbi:MAG: methyltransferase domain-containing protein [Elusimicrobia bacterium]|nr:methyltransferase domain-containing protein [Elusimicrobiota bacterium]
MRRFYAAISQCRVCRSKNLTDILFLGKQPMANSLKDGAQAAAPKSPLTLAHCRDCRLVQIRETIKKETLFSNYVWVSGTSPTTRRYADELAQKILQIAELKPAGFVVEIASNDGTFLRPFIKMGYRNVLGIDPAANIAAMANKEGVQTLTAFWNKKLARDLAQKRGKAHVIIARNVIAHVSELHDVIAGIEELLSDAGIGAIEFHYAADILEGLQYDSMYHEHLCYFSIRSLSRLLAQYRLIPFHADLSPISGGAIVLYFSKAARRLTPALRDLLAQERRKNINSLSRWKKFAADCLRHRTLSAQMLSPLRGKAVVGFGASARSSTYLNFCGIGRRHIQAVIDNNPIKHGKFTPGSCLPIVSFRAGMRMHPGAIFIFAWNFKEEIMKRCRQAGYRGKFLTAFPNKPSITEALK